MSVYRPVRREILSEYPNRHRSRQCPPEAKPHSGEQITKSAWILDQRLGEIYPPTTGLLQKTLNTQNLQPIALPSVENPNTVCRRLDPLRTSPLFVLCRRLRIALQSPPETLAPCTLQHCMNPSIGREVHPSHSCTKPTRAYRWREAISSWKYGGTLGRPQSGRKQNQPFPHPNSPCRYQSGIPPRPSVGRPLR